MITIVELIDGILYYEYNQLLFSVEVTESMCKKHYGQEVNCIEHTIEWDEPVEKNYKGFCWPLPSQLSDKQIIEIAELYHSESLQCSDSEIRELLEWNQEKYRKFLNRN
jgi:hypothetical protein